MYLLFYHVIFVWLQFWTAKNKCVKINKNKYFKHHYELLMKYNYCNSMNGLLNTNNLIQSNLQEALVVQCLLGGLGIISNPFIPSSWASIGCM